MYYTKVAVQKCNCWCWVSTNLGERQTAYNGQHTRSMTTVQATVNVAPLVLWSADLQPGLAAAG